MLEKITLRGFKSFHDAEIDLGRLTLIVGANASGKSNLRDALRFLDEDARDHALLVYRSEASPYSKVRRIMDLPGIAEILAEQDLGRLHAAGWLEDTAAFSEADAPDDAEQEETP